MLHQRILRDKILFGRGSGEFYLNLSDKKGNRWKREEKACAGKEIQGRKDRKNTQEKRKKQQL